MKKAVRIAFFIAFACLAVVPAAAQYYHIAFGNFPEDPAYRKHVEEFFSIYKYVNHWTPKWEYEVPKDKAIATLESLVKETGDVMAGEKKENVDLALFRALLRSCLYNLDAGKQYQNVVDELGALEARYPKDYRPCWLLGNFYIYSGNNFDGIRQYDYIFENIFTDQIAADVVVDYCAAAALALMPATCLKVMDGIAADNNVADPKEMFPLYEQVKSQLKSPPLLNDIPSKDIFALHEREKEKGYLCRLYGAWLPKKDDWMVQFIGADRSGLGGVIYIIPMENSAGRKIQVTLAGLFAAQPLKSFESFMEYSMKNVKNAVPYNAGEGRWSWQVFEMRDPETNKENGGMHGFIVFVKRAQPKVKGTAIEAPARIPRSKEGGVKYYAAIGGYTRFDGDIFYAFVLDSCEAVFEESKKQFFDFLDKVLLD